MTSRNRRVPTRENRIISRFHAVTQKTWNRRSDFRAYLKARGHRVNTQWNRTVPDRTVSEYMILCYYPSPGSSSIQPFCAKILHAARFSHHRAPRASPSKMPGPCPNRPARQLGALTTTPRHCTLVHLPRLQPPPSTPTIRPQQS